MAATSGEREGEGGSGSASKVLDLCGYQLPDLDKIEIGDEVEEIDLTENRLKGLDARLLALKALKRLSFRKNLLTDVSALEELQSAPGLAELVLYDNLIKHIPPLDKYRALEKLDISYNKIKSMEPVAQVSETVGELYLAANRIGEIESLSALPRLTLLELGSNRIRKMHNLERLTGLTELWLGRNKIEAIEGLAALTKLRRLSVQNNRLLCIQGLETCTELEELYLSFNGLTKMEGLATLSKLKILDLGNNQLERVEGLESLVQLEDLWMNNNAVATLEALEEGLSHVKTVKTAYFEGNPCSKAADYKRKLIEWLPQLEQLDVDEIQR